MSTSPVSTTGESGILSSPSISTPTSLGGQSHTVTTPPAASSSSDGNDNPAGSISPSTSLYLYTFLATLLLLLSITSAVILRSLVLRRRQRRLVQEAIRNGTWIPSSPRVGGFPTRGRSSRRRADHRKKPKIWEAVTEKRDMDVHGKLELDWDSIKPFSATAVGVPGSETQAASANRGSEPTATAGASPRIRVSFVQRILNVIDPTPSSPLSPLPEVEIPNNNANDLSCDVNEAGLRSRPHNVRVAVLIAMPSQSTSRLPPQHSSTPALNSASQPSTRPSLSISLESSPLNQSQPQIPQELPQLEFGIAEVRVCQEQDAVDDVGRQDENRPRTRKGSTESAEIV